MRNYGDDVTEIVESAREAARRLWRNRKVTLPVVISLALGIGANTALFTLVDAMFLEPLPVRDPDRLLAIYTSDPYKPEPLAVSFPNYQDLRKRSQSFEHIAALTDARVNISSNDEIHEATSALVTANYFVMTGVMPALGKAFDDVTEGEHMDLPPAVISHALWKKRFQSDGNVIGKTITINKSPFAISGVMPASYKGFERIGSTEVWLPMRAYRTVLERPDWLLGRRAVMFYVVGRLKTGVGFEQASAEVDAIGKELAAKFPNENAGRSFKLMSIEEASVGPVKRASLVKAAVVLMGAAAVVLFIAIANVGNVLLSFASVRRREMAVRLAIGATRHALLRQILCESALIVAAGGILGILVAIGGRELLWRFRPDDLMLDNLRLPLNARVLGFAALLSLLAGFLASLLPALKSLDGNITNELRERFRKDPPAFQRTGFRQTLVIAQVALSMVAVMSADVFVKSLSNARSADPGFDTDHLASFSVNPHRLGLKGEQRAEFYLSLQEKLSRIPGISSAAVSSNPLIRADSVRRTVFLNGNEDTKNGVILRVSVVSTRYFETTDQLILRGRDFHRGDTYSNPWVAIVNEAMARRFWPNDTAIGKRIRFFGDVSDQTVIGVARDTVYSHIGEPPEPCIFVPLMQTSPPMAFLIVRTVDDPANSTSRIASVVKAHHPDQPAPEIVTIRHALDQALWAPRTAAALLTILGLIALALAAIGVYAVTTHMVSQRTGELGVRIAMGACPMDVMELILRQYLTLILPGLAIGAVASFLLSRLLFQNLLFDVKETDLEPYLVASLILAVAGLAASWLPARRAIRMEPVLALREQ